MIYWDSSCVMKLYAPEADSHEYVQLAVRSGPLHTSDLTKTELFYGLVRKQAAGDIAKGSAATVFAKFLKDEAKGRFTFYPLGEDVRSFAEKIALRCYSATPPVPIRTLDGLHLATAMVAGLRQVATADERMLQALPLLELVETETE
jgi:uncharacterized protein